MSEWWRYLKGKPFYWVLDGTHAPADLFMLRHVIGRTEQAPALRAARLALAESPEIASLKSHLQRKPFSLWSTRYDTTLWTLRLLAETGAAGADEPVAEALDQVLDQPEQAVSGRGSPVNSNAIILHIALAFGFGEDERVRRRLLRLWETVEQGELPVGEQARADWLVQAAMALAEQPQEARDVVHLPTLARYLEQLDSRSLARYAHYGFPVFDRPDDLILARSALRLELTGAWLRPWVDRIVAAQDEQGQWHLDRTRSMPAGVQWERAGEASRWLTAQALYILRAYYGE